MKRYIKFSPDVLPLPVRPAGLLSAPIGSEDASRNQVVTYLNSHAAATKRATPKRLMQRFGSGRVAQGFLRGPPVRKSDPYLLLLLADQEFDQGREKQAGYLVEAAYKAYDQQNEFVLAEYTP
jgi:hypothetical protein